jgi:hypothetical protein
VVPYLYSAKIGSTYSRIIHEGETRSWDLLHNVL